MRWVKKLVVRAGQICWVGAVVYGFGLLGVDWLGALILFAVLAVVAKPLGNLSYRWDPQTEDQVTPLEGDWLQCARFWKSAAHPKRLGPRKKQAPKSLPIL